MRPAPTQPVSLALRLGALAGGLVAAMGLYTGVNLAVSATMPTRTLPTAIDGWVDFCPEAMLVYGGIYALALTPLCLLADRRVLIRGAAAYAVLLFSALPFWILWPVTVPRTPVPVHDLWTWAVALMRFIDPPANCFPSMHVAETVLAALICWRLDRLTGATVAVLALLVWWSTLALDQHWFLDGAFGAGLAVGAYALCFGWRPLSDDAWTRLSRWTLLGPMALFATQFMAFAMPWWFDLVDPAAIGAP